MTGIICLDKQEHMTSFSTVARARRIVGEKKAGHAGTLDPMATGILPVLFGGATRFTLWLVSKVLANTAKMNAFVGISDSRCKSRCVLVCHGHDIVGKALCGLHAYTRELCKLLCQKYQRLHDGTECHF